MTIKEITMTLQEAQDLHCVYGFYMENSCKGDVKLERHYWDKFKKLADKLGIDNVIEADRVVWGIFSNIDAILEEEDKTKQITIAYERAERQ